MLIQKERIRLFTLTSITSGLIKRFSYKIPRDILNIKFQFHYGTIKSELISVLHYMRPHFNSTMVRLKANDNGISAPLTLISIPLWYD